MKQSNQRFNEDRAELEAHFAERVAAYIELGDTPEQANLAAREKFGETETVMRTLHWQSILRSPLLWGLICATGYLLMTAFNKSVGVSTLFFFCYALYLCRGFSTKKC